MIYLLTIILISNVAFFRFLSINCIYDYIALHYTCIYCVITYYFNSINFQTLNQHIVVMTAPFPLPFPNTLITRN